MSTSAPRVGENGEVTPQTSGRKGGPGFGKMQPEKGKLPPGKRNHWGIPHLGRGDKVETRENKKALWGKTQKGQKDKKLAKSPGAQKGKGPFFAMRTEKPYRTTKRRTSNSKKKNSKKRSLKILARGR